MSDSPHQGEEKKLRDFYSQLRVQRKSSLDLMRKKSIDGIIEDPRASAAEEGKHALEENKTITEALALIMKDELVKVPLFKDCPDEFISALVQNLIPIAFLPGENIINEGEEGTEMYFLTEGEVEVTKDEKVIVSLKKGAFFGEVALIMDNTLRTAGIRAKTDCDTCKLTKSALFRVFEDFPVQKVNIMSLAQTRLTQDALRKVLGIKSLNAKDFTHQLETVLKSAIGDKNRQIYLLHEEVKELKFEKTKLEKKVEMYSEIKRAPIQTFSLNESSEQKSKKDTIILEPNSKWKQVTKAQLMTLLSPESVEKLQKLQEERVPPPDGSAQAYLKMLSIHRSLFAIRHLRSRLGNMEKEFFVSFIELDGLKALNKCSDWFGKKYRRSAADVGCQVYLVLCWRTLFSKPFVLSAFTNELVDCLPKCFEFAVSTRNIWVKTRMFELFAALALSSHEGYELMWKNVELISKKKRLPNLFGILINQLTLIKEAWLQTSIMMLMNALIGVDDVEERCRIRRLVYELGFIDLVELMLHDTQTMKFGNMLKTQLEGFKAQAEHDEQELEDLIASVPVDLEDPHDMLKRIQSSIPKDSKSSLTNVMQQLLLLAENKAAGSAPWEYLETVIFNAVGVKEGQDFQRRAETSVAEFRQKLKEAQEAKPIERPVAVAKPAEKKEEKAEETKPAPVTGGPPAPVTGGPPPPPMEGAPVTGGPPPPPMEGAPVTGGPPPPPMAGAPVTGGPPPPPMMGGAPVTGGPPPPPMMGGAPVTGGPPPPPPMMGGGGPPPPPPMMGGPPPPPGMMGGPPPPPGMMGGPPPPPGMGMRGGGMGLPAKPKPKPKVPMLPFYWTKIPNLKVLKTGWNPQNSVFKDADQVVLRHSGEIEQFFKKPEKKKVVEKKEAKPSVVTLIDMKRANNTAIMLSQFKKKFPNYEAMGVAIDNLDDDKYSQQDIETLLKYAPEAEEIEAVTSYTGDVKILGTAEKYFLAISKVDKLAPKLEAFKFKKEFDTQVAAIENEVKLLTKTCTEIVESKKFHKLLELILAVGNYLNAQNSRGGAYGFKLDTLKKLPDTRSPSNRKMTLLHYIVQVVEVDINDLKDWTKEISELAKANRLSVDFVKADFANLKKALAKLDTLVANPGPEKFYTKIAEFHTRATTELSMLQTYMEPMEKSIEKLASHFGEDPKKAQLGDILTIIENFENQYLRCIEENEKAKAAEEKKKKREAQKAARAARPKKKGQTASLPPEECSVDSLLSSVRAGNFKLKKTKAPQ